MDGIGQILIAFSLMSNGIANRPEAG